MLPRLGPRAPALECGYLAVPPLSVRFSPRECGNVPSAGACAVAAGAVDSAAGAGAAGAEDSAAGAVADGAVAAGGVRGCRGIAFRYSSGPCSGSCRFCLPHCG